MAIMFTKTFGNFQRKKEPRTYFAEEGFKISENKTL